MRRRVALYSVLGLVAVTLGLVYLVCLRPELIPKLDNQWVSEETEVVDVTDYQPPPEPADRELVDDLLSDKNPAFVPELIDRRPEGDWQVNASAAVLRLDVPMLKPDTDAELLELRPSYADAISHAPSGMNVLPSINMIDGKAKQFDDGLFAAIDLAYYNGLPPKLESHLALIKRIHERVAAGSPASAFLAAGLKIAGEPVKSSHPEESAAWLSRFESNAMISKPIGFYTWSTELECVFRFMRFFQQTLLTDQPGLILDLTCAVASDKNLLEDYKRVNEFFTRLTNPLDNLSFSDVLPNGGKIEQTQRIAVFPSSRSKETELFRRLFPNGLSPNADLMREIVRAIRSGKVDLAPRPDSGWYDHQIYALETFLLPEKGAENAKLLLTAPYKKRMLEAFQALITKRRETHVRNLAEAKSAEVMRPPTSVKPRLRVEPSPTYYLRTARSYDFLLNFLLAAVGEKGLTSMHGLREGGSRDEPLLEELRSMRELFYGFHLLSAEDIGMAPDLRPDEPVDRPRCEAKAEKWLSSYATDADMKVDTRVSVPIYFDIVERKTRLWATAGVRLARLDVSYARPPKIKPGGKAADWQEVDPGLLDAASYVIAVDEFAELEIPGLEPLTRKEFRESLRSPLSR